MNITIDELQNERQRLTKDFNDPDFNPFRSY